MRKMLVFVVFCIPLYAWGENAVFNSSFDMSPWDTGWTIETDTFCNSGGYSSVEVEVKPDSGKSLQNCCYLRTLCERDVPRGERYAEVDARAMITQKFDGITGCMIKAYLKWDWAPYRTWDQTPWKMVWGWVETTMEGCINNEWKLIWKTASNPKVETTWTEVCTTLAGNDVLSGIRFYVRSNFCNGYCGAGWYMCHSYLWVDDIYVGKAEIEEIEELRV